MLFVNGSMLALGAHTHTHTPARTHAGNTRRANFLMLFHIHFCQVGLIYTKLFSNASLRKQRSESVYSTRGAMFPHTKSLTSQPALFINS